jgi:anti-sigma-K factor RskA
MTEDRFAHDDAAYVLGALPPQERAEFETHLQTCDECAARVIELSGMRELLATVSLDELTDDLPDTLLPGLVRRARAERNRRRWVTTGLAGLAAACLVALAVAVWPSNSPAGPHPQAMAALVSSPIHASATLSERRWGTAISLDCYYDGGAVPKDWAYGLTVIGTDNAKHSLGSWTLVAGKDTRFTSGTALHRDQIKQIQITAPDGTAILQLTS